MKKGFTLIELLIVVSIIGILAVALIPSLTDAPARARDAGRKSMVNDVVAAIESFNLDNGRYPAGNFCVGVADNSIIEEEPGTDKAALLLYFNAGAPSSSEITSGTCTEGKTYAGYLKTDTGYWVYVQLEKKATHKFVDAATGFSDVIGVGETAKYFAIQR
jgi:prepilin-type N-terminal cleavage/methylation domain-containing protein